MQIPALPPAISPVAPVAASASATPNGAFSKALDQAAQRRAEDEPKAKDANASNESKSSKSEDSADESSPEPSEAYAAKSSRIADAPPDALLASVIPLRPEVAPMGHLGRAKLEVAVPVDGETGDFAHQLSLSLPSTASSAARDLLASTAPSSASPVATGDAAARVSSEAPPQATPQLRDAAMPLPVAIFAPAGTLVSTTATAAAPQAAATFTAEAHIQPSLGSPGFGAAFGAQLSIMAREGVKEARLHLNPAEMGPVTVQITVTGQIARVDMVAEAALTRQILEQSMPSLASALRESGLTLAGGGVFEQPRQPGQNDPATGQGSAAAGTEEGLDEAESRLLAAASAAAMDRISARGVVDLYA